MDTEKLDLQKVYLAAYVELANYPTLRENLEITFRELPDSLNFALIMKSWCLSGQIPMRRESETVRWPNGWWQAFKEQYGPRWLKARFPVVYAEKVVEKTTHIYFVCPHVNPGEDRSLHYKFMATGTPLAEKM